MAETMKRKQPEATGGVMPSDAANEPPTMKTRRTQEAGPSGTSTLPYQTNPDFLVSLIHTKCEQLRLPDNKVFVAERTDKVVDVFKGLVKHNFLSVPVLQKAGHKWYGFLDMADIVNYITQTFGDEKLSISEDFWKMIEREEEFQKKTVNDIMKFPLGRRNPFHPVKRGYSLLYVMEALGKERNLHRVPVVDDDRNLMNLITQSQMVRFLHQNMERLGDKRKKPVAEVEGVFHAISFVNHNQKAIEAFNLMMRDNVSGVAVVNDDGKLISNLSLRDLKLMSTDGRLFWRLYQNIDTYLLKLKSEDTHRPRDVQCCTLDTSLEDVINMLTEHNIHRVYIVDSDKKPVGVISLKDLLYEILN